LQLVQPLELRVSQLGISQIDPLSEKGGEQSMHPSEEYLEQPKIWHKPLVVSLKG
jgi:hypothetical protein